MSNDGTRATHFADWLRTKPVSGYRVAIDLGISSQRVYSYANHGVTPQRDMLRQLVAYTGLPAEAFLFPYDPIRFERRAS